MSELALELEDLEPWERRCAFYPDLRRGRPIYLSGVECGPTRELEAEGYDIGILAQPRSKLEGKVPTHRLWAGDNGMFSGAVSEAEWWAWAQRLPRDTIAAFGDTSRISRLMVPGQEVVPYGCLFLTAPDVPGSMEQTWERSRPWFERIRSLGFPVAVCAQNGAQDFEPLWEESDSWDALFVGGSPECEPCGYVREVTAFQVKHCPSCGAPLREWKVGEWAGACVREAQLLGKWTHLGRVNSAKRLRVAAGWGMDSVDGTFLGFGPAKNGPQLRAWLDALA